jgi:hypothetical protein
VALIRFVAAARVIVAVRLVVAAAARLVVPPLVARSLEARSIAVDSVNA